MTMKQPSWRYVSASRSRATIASSLVSARHDIDFEGLQMKPIARASATLGFFGLGLTLGLVLWSAPAEAGGTPSVDEIVARTNYVAYCQGDDGRAKVKMTIVDAQGRKRGRELTIIRRDDPAPARIPEAKRATYCGDQRYYVYFRRPADVNKTAFLVWKKIDKDDDRWLYLPALDLVKRLSAADKRTSFVGSNFFYEDISGRNISDDTHKLVKTTKNYYVIENKPKSPGSVEFASYKMWIHRTSFVVVKVEYFDRKGKKYRLYEAKKVQDIDGFPTVTRATMTDLKSGAYTELTYSKVNYNLGLPERVFTERSLRRAPRKYLR